MAWFWFILFAMLLVIEVYQAEQLQKFNRKLEGIMAALITVLLDRGISGNQAAEEYIENLGHTLMVRDYDYAMKGICKFNGLIYRKDESGHLIEPELKRVLVCRLGQRFTETANHIKLVRGN